MIVPSLINVRALVKSSHATINQKGCILVMHFQNWGTMMHFTIVHRTSNSCPSIHACLPLLPEASTHFPWIQTMLSWPNLSSLLKYVFMQTMLICHETVLLAQEKNLLAHCQVSPSCMSYNTNDTRCLQLCPMTILVNMSAGLFSDLICLVNVSPIAKDSWIA